jgi:hypothetical protein
MALIDKIQNTGNQPSQVDSFNNPTNLDLKEIEFILQLIKQSHFQGQDIEFLYNLVLKLQKIYLSQNTK